MFNIKWGLYAAAAGFVLAIIISLLWGHTGILRALLRGAGFGAVFFGLGLGVWALINTFIPELLIDNDQAGPTDNPFTIMEHTGSRVNITLDDTNAAVPDEDRGASGTEEIGNFNDLVSGNTDAAKDIDQNPPTSYTDNVMEGFAPIFDTAPVNNDEGGFSLDFGAFTAGMGGKDASKSSDIFAASGAGDGTGNTDSFMDSFSIFPNDNDSEKRDTVSTPQRKVSGNKDKQLEGDFKAKDIAAGLRTVLEKDKKG